MKVSLDVFSLCESAADLVGSTLEIFKKRRSKGHFANKVKVNKIVDAIMAKPKKFLHLSMEVLLNLSGMSQGELRNKIVVAVTILGSKKYKTMLQYVVFETDDERALRGD